MRKDDLMETLTDDRLEPHVFLGVLLGILAVVAAVLYVFFPGV